MTKSKLLVTKEGGGMRQDLIGYLLDSVDEEERAEIESARQSPETEYNRARSCNA